MTSVRRVNSKKCVFQRTCVNFRKLKREREEEIVLRRNGEKKKNKIDDENRHIIS